MESLTDNAARLLAILNEGQSYSDLTDAVYEIDDSDAVARYLDARGVLAPTATEREGSP